MRGAMMGAVLAAGMLAMPSGSFGGERQAEVKAAPAVLPAADEQKQLAADMEKLVRMSAELKVSVDKSTKDQLSLDVLRKADEVEKLARSLKDRVRDMR